MYSFDGRTSQQTATAVSAPAPKAANWDRKEVREFYHGELRTIRYGVSHARHIVTKNATGNQVEREYDMEFVDRERGWTVTDSGR